MLINPYIYIYIYIYIYCVLDPTVIDEGSYVPGPSVITRGNKTVKIGTPVYVYTGYDVIIDCSIVNGTPPITIQWFRNGSPDSTRGNVSTITITDASNGDVFKCKANNVIGFDTENTVIHVEYGKYVCCIHRMFIPHSRKFSFAIISLLKIFERENFMISHKNILTTN